MRVLGHNAMSDLTIRAVESQTFDAGKEYQGEIQSIEKRETEQWGDYLDLTIIPDGPDVEATPSYALPEEGVSRGHDLGKLVDRMLGGEFEVGDDYDLESVLVGSRVAFNTYETEDGYVNVEKDSVRPVGAERDTGPTEQSDATEETEALSEGLIEALEEVGTPSPRMAVVGHLSQNGYDEFVAEFNEAWDQGEIPNDGEAMTGIPQ